MSNVIAKTGGMEREVWLEKRKQGVGGSDMAAIAGFNKWKSPIVVYMEKVGEAPETKLANEEAAYWGNVMEDTVAKEFELRTGLKTRRKNQLLQHPDEPWMLANVDRVLVGHNEGLECKTASEYLKGEWEGDSVPMNYLLQCQHYMAVLGYDAWWIAVLVGGNKFIYKKIERDEFIIDQIIEIGREFWNDHVLAKNPPIVDGSQASTDLLNAMYPEADPESEIDLDATADELIQTYEEAKADEQEAKKRKDEAQNQLKNLLGEYETGYLSQHRVTWKTQERRSVDSKRLKAERPELYEEYSKVTKARPFNVYKRSDS